MMPAYDLEGADRVTTVGASDITMRIWNELEAAGDEGLTRDELVERVGPHINRGYARRRYFTRLKSAAAYRRATFPGDYENPRQWPSSSSVAKRLATEFEPVWEDADIESALKYVLGNTLRNMVRDGSAIKKPDSRYRVGRQPRHRDPTIIDMTGDRTRLHMNGVEAIRTLEPALERHRESFRAQLTSEEWTALEKLIALYKEQIRLGFPNVPR